MKRSHKQFNGRVSQLTRGRREWLVESGRACWWLPYRNVEQCVEAAGL